MISFRNKGSDRLVVSEKIKNETVEIYKHVNGLSSGKFFIFFGNGNIWWQWKLVDGNCYLCGLETEKHFHEEGGCSSHKNSPTKPAESDCFSWDFEIKHFGSYAFIVGCSHSSLLSKLNFFLEEVEVSLRKEIFSLSIGFLQSSCCWTKENNLWQSKGVACFWLRIVLKFVL